MSRQIAKSIQAVANSVTDLAAIVTTLSGSVTGSLTTLSSSLVTSISTVSSSFVTYRSSSVNYYANRPNSGSRGQTFQPIDGALTFVDDGSQWRPVIGGTLGYEVPQSGSLTAVFTAGRSTTVTNDNGQLFLSASNISGHDFRILKTAMPGGIFSATIHITPLFPPNASGLPWFGILFRESSTGKVDTWGMYAGGPANKSAGGAVAALNRNWNTAADATQVPASFTNTDFTDYHISTHIGTPLGGMWFQLYYNPTAAVKSYRYSNDGRHWREIITVASNNVFTPDEVGFCIGNVASIGNSGGTDATMQALVNSWKVASG